MNRQTLDHVDQALGGVVVRRRSERDLKLLQLQLIGILGMSASHTTPVPALASHREESPQRHRKIPENPKIPG